MRKSGIIVVLMMLTVWAQAQFIDNKVSVQAGLTSGKYVGPETISEQEFITSSLYTNYKLQFGASFRGLIKLSKNLSTGVGIDYRHASQWERPPQPDYTNSETNTFTFAPLLQIHNAFRKTGIANRLKLFATMAPAMGVSSVSLDHPVYTITQNGDTRVELLESSDLFWGFGGDIGMEYTLVQSIGVFASYSVTYNQVESELYEDKSFTGAHWQAGIVIRLMKDKKYFY